MEGNVVTAAKWLGASLVAASLILVAGVHWVLSSWDRDRLPRPIPIPTQAQTQPQPPRLPAGLMDMDSLPSDLDELAKSFRGEPEPTDAAKPAPTATPAPSRSYFEAPAQSPAPRTPPE